MDLDVQLNKALVKFGFHLPKRIICCRHENFQYTEELFILLTLGKSALDRVEFVNCCFYDIPADFFGRLIKHVQESTEAEQIVPYILFQFNPFGNGISPIPETLSTLDNNFWKHAGTNEEKFTAFLVNQPAEPLADGIDNNGAENTQKQIGQLTFKVEISTKLGERNTRFYTFKLCRKDGLLDKVKRTIFSHVLHRQQSKKEKENKMEDLVDTDGQTKDQSVGHLDANNTNNAEKVNLRIEDNPIGNPDDGKNDTSGDSNGNAKNRNIWRRISVEVKDNIEKRRQSKVAVVGPADAADGAQQEQLKEEDGDLEENREQEQESSIETTETKNEDEAIEEGGEEGKGKL